ncbi:CYTH domain-containing protein [candidate division WWE3 bacterium]|nr:CYTH domain-containing protein [candidate division WWE3 bacterium]
MGNVEVELRSFIDEKKYHDLKKFLDENGKFLKQDTQITHYFDTKQDLRIQLNNSGSKVWLKKGAIHDEAREEIEIVCKKKDFENLKRLFEALGFSVEIVWKRNRLVYMWEGTKMFLDYTEGYGYIIEIEKMVSADLKDKTLGVLRKKFEKLGISITKRDVFEERYEYYKNNWKSLIEV